MNAISLGTRRRLRQDAPKPLSTQQCTVQRLQQQSALPAARGETVMPDMMRNYFVHLFRFSRANCVRVTTAQNVAARMVRRVRRTRLRQPLSEPVHLRRTLRYVQH